MEPRLRPEAEALRYVVRRSARNRAVVTRSGGGDTEITLLEWARLRSVNWAEIARVILTDALEEPPLRKLTHDYGRFLFTPAGHTRTVNGSEIAEWISSWSLPRLPGEAVRTERR